MQSRPRQPRTRCRRSSWSGEGGGRKTGDSAIPGRPGCPPDLEAGGGSKGAALASRVSWAVSSGNSRCWVLLRHGPSELLEAEAEDLMGGQAVLDVFVHLENARVAVFDLFRVQF